MTDTDDNSSSAESMLQPAGYNTARRAVLLTVAFIGPWVPSSGIRAGTCELLLLSAVCGRCNSHNSVVLLLCFAAAIDIGSSSKAAVPLSQATERATVPAHLLLSSFAL